MSNIAKEWKALGDRYFKLPNFQEAVRYYKMAAEKGDADAQFALAECYQYGLGVKRDHDEFLSWLKKAALQGHEKAKIKCEYYSQAFEWWCLADEYYYGDGEQEQDYSKAVKYYTMAALRGDPDAQVGLGDCYYHGEGVEADLFAAAFWYAKAAAWGNESALEGLKLVGECIDVAPWKLLAQTDDVADFESLTTATEFFNRAYAYEKGKGVTESALYAIACYCRAACMGSAAAQCNLGLFYEKGNGVAKNGEIAVYWAKKSAMQGNQYAQCNLGVYYYTGKIVPKDYRQALSWLQKADAQGSGRAAYWIGRYYGDGKAIAKNLAMAKRWYLRSKQLGYADAQKGLDWVAKEEAEQLRKKQEAERRKTEQESAQRQAAERARREKEQQRADEATRREAAEQRRADRQAAAARRAEEEAKYDREHRFRHFGTKVSVRASSPYTYMSQEVVDLTYTATFYFKTESGREQTKTASGEKKWSAAYLGTNGISVSDVEYSHAYMLGDYYG